MQVGVRVPIEFALITGGEIERLRDALRETGVSESGSVKVGTLMTVSLVADDAFKIRILSRPDQQVFGSNPSRWSWRVTPTERGDYDLNLTVSVRVIIPGGGQEPHDIKVLRRSVHVSVNAIYTIREFLFKNWQWFLGWTFLWEVLKKSLALTKRVYTKLRDRTPPAPGPTESAESNESN